MTVSNRDPGDETPETRVFLFGLQQFLRLGFTVPQAERMLGAGTDWHDAERLVGDGCDPAVAFDILI